MQHIQRYLDEIDKILEEGGAYILITFGEPELREKYLKRDGWSHTVIEIPLLKFELPKPEPPKNSSNNRNKNKKKRRRRKKVPEEKMAFYLYICQKGSPVSVMNHEEMAENIVVKEGKAGEGGEVAGGEKKENATGGETGANEASGGIQPQTATGN